MTLQNGLQKGNAFGVTVALDCGPACFSWTDATVRDEFHWAWDKWLDSNHGMFTLDGITYTNRNGLIGILS